MSNYPAGAENDINAPYNKEEMQGETIGLFDCLENLEMPYEVRCELKLFEANLDAVKIVLKNSAELFDSENRKEVSKLLRRIEKIILEPQIFIEMNNTILPEQIKINLKSLVDRIDEVDIKLNDFKAKLIEHQFSIKRISEDEFKENKRHKKLKKAFQKRINEIIKTNFRYE